MSGLLCFGLGQRYGEQVVVQRLHLGIARVVLPVLDAEHGVVREPAVLGDLGQVTHAALKFGDNLGKGV